MSEWGKRDDRAEVIQVIRTTLLRAGRGTEEDPNRIVEQYWSLDGTLLWQFDRWTDRKPWQP